ncbi:MAG: transposase, partial [Gammaproteobacteria bacterium]|nr:transposase [Gammaproteobacteria bacterium]
MLPQYVKAYVKRGKNDTNDAAAICEAMSRPSMRFVAVKTAEQQADLMLVATRNLLLKQRTQLANAIRGHAAEFGVVGAQGIGQVSKVLARFAADERVPSVAKETLAVLADQYDDVDRRLAEVTNRIEAWHRTNSTSER